MDKKKMNSTLNSVDVPDKLEARIRDNWHEQIRESGEKARIHSSWLAATAASLLLAAFVLRIGFSTPTVIEAALADIVADEKHQAGVSITMDSILATTHIRPPIDSMLVRMTKYCSLNRDKTIHMQIAGTKQGSVHLFVKEGQFDKQLWQDNSGQSNEMEWKIIKPRHNLSVLVLRTTDMNPENVERLIQHMFYS